MSTSTPSMRGPVGLGLPLVVLAIGSAVLLHLNRSAAWGWLVGGLLLVTTALVVRRHTRLCRGSLAPFAP